MNRYKILPHTADEGILAYGRSRAELLENAAYGMFDLMFELAGLEPTRFFPVEADGDTFEELVVDWLSKLLAVAEIQGLVFSTFEIEYLEAPVLPGPEQPHHRLKGRAGGVELVKAVQKGQPIKAVTYHHLEIVKKGGRYQATIFFDV